MGLKPYYLGDTSALARIMQSEVGGLEAVLLGPLSTRRGDTQIGTMAERIRLLAVDS